MHAAKQFVTFDVEQPTPAESLTTTDACRAVFDQLIEDDLLGLMFSSSHMHRYLAALTTVCESNLAMYLTRLVSNVEQMHRLHESMLQMYQGVHIPESSIGCRETLFGILEASLQTWMKAKDIGDVHFETCLVQLESVENAWKYRHACSATPFFLL